MSDSLGPFLVEAVCPHSPDLDKQEIDTVVSTDCATQTPYPKRLGAVNKHHGHSQYVQGEISTAKDNE